MVNEFLPHLVSVLFVEVEDVCLRKFKRPKLFVETRGGDKGICKPALALVLDPTLEPYGIGPDVQFCFDLGSVQEDDLHVDKGR